MKRPLRGIALFTLCCAALLISGCATFLSPLAPGLEMEAAGQYPEAAEAYLDLLERDPYLEEARARLRKIGPLAVEDLMRMAVEADREGDYVAAMRRVREMEQLRREAGAAGVVLSLPEALASFREEATRGAVAALIRTAEEARADAAWVEAEESYRRALRYATGDQQSELQDTVLELQVRRAEAELSEGRFADAYDRARHVLEQLEVDDPLRKDASRLSRAALDAAARYVVLMPVGVSDDLAEHLPEGFRVELQEIFEEHFWQGTPRFVRSVSRDARRRELRRLPHDRSRIQHRHAMEFGRVLGADLVVITEIVDFHPQQADADTEQRSDRVLAGTSTETETADTAADTILEVEAEVAYRIIDPSFGLVLMEGAVRASIQHPLEQSVFAEVVHEPAVTGEERASSSVESTARRVHPAMQRLINLIVEELSERLYRDASPGHEPSPVLSGN